MSAPDDETGAEAAVREVLMELVDKAVATIEPRSETAEHMADTTENDDKMSDGLGGNKGGEDAAEESSSGDESSDSSDSSDESDDGAEGTPVRHDGVEDDDDLEVMSMIHEADVQPFSPPRTRHEDFRPPLCRPEPIGNDEELRLLGEVAHVILDSLTVTIGPVQGQDVMDRETTLCKEDRTVVGAVDDVIGNVQTPTYVVRFESEDEIRRLGMAKGVGIWVPARSKKLVNITQLEEDRRAHRNPVDASGENDEMDDQERYFSSDEAERAWKREQEQSRRPQGRGRGNGRRDGGRGRDRGRERGRGRGGRGFRGNGGQGWGDRDGRGDGPGFSNRDRADPSSTAYEPDYNPIRRPQVSSLPPKPPAPVDGGNFNTTLAQPGFGDRGYGDRGGGPYFSGRRGREDSRGGQYNQVSQDTPNYAAPRMQGQDDSSSYQAAGGRYPPSYPGPQPPSHHPHMPPPPFGAVPQLPPPSASGPVPPIPEWVRNYLAQIYPTFPPNQR